MRSFSRCLPASVALLVLFAASVFAQEKTDADSRRAKALAIAKRYAEHEWVGTEANRIHGKDADGNRIDTPDGKQRGFVGWRPGEKSVGIPYKWGGFTRVEDFDRAIAAGKYAGEIPNGLGASRHSAGVDCSGFVSRCWELPLKQSTRSLGRLCYRLDRFQDLRPGDIVNTNDGHVMLFAGFANASRTKIRVYEAALPRVLSRTHAVRDLEKAGYEPLRYKPFDKRWKCVEPAAETFRARGPRAGSIDDAWKADAAAPPSTTPITAQVGQWCEYRVGVGVELADGVSIRRVISDVAKDGVELQCTTTIGDEHLETLASLDPTASVLDRLISFRDLTEAPKDLAAETTSIDSGIYSIGGRRFRSERIRSDLAGTLVIRGRTLPFRMSVDAVVSDEVPGEGVLRADFTVSITIQGRESTEVRAFELASFGR